VTISILPKRKDLSKAKNQETAAPGFS